MGTATVGRGLVAVGAGRVWVGGGGGEVGVAEMVDPRPQPARRKRSRRKVRVRFIVRLYNVTPPPKLFVELDVLQEVIVKIPVFHIARVLEDHAVELAVVGEEEGV